MIPRWLKRLAYRRGLRPKPGHPLYSYTLAWFYGRPPRADR